MAEKISIGVRVTRTIEESGLFYVEFDAPPTEDEALKAGEDYARSNEPENGWDHEDETYHADNIEEGEELIKED